MKETQGGSKDKGGRKPKFDYDSDDFYREVFALAFQGATNAEIAEMLGETELGQSLSPTAFSLMVNGKYDKWTEEENERRSARLVKELERARRKINFIVRGRFLKTALGGGRTRNRNTVTRRMRIDGVLTDDEEIQTTESEIEAPPSLQALSVWLRHHDPEWRRIERGEDAGDAPKDIERGIDIEAWIDKEVGNDQEPQGV